MLPASVHCTAMNAFKAYYRFKNHSVLGSSWNFNPIVTEGLIFFPPMAQQPLVGQGLLIIEASQSHSNTSHSVGPLWTRDQLVAETST
jgi:hypothetical protein